ncbi:hypothetical protein IWW36_000373 [Coemansia brasiliensis]|uniref:Uncharacterized protein n=1 Tax=Coemansia brasiliensis TaxID=2650707 RepID=A0A9W8IDL4_9FUNG|nr:hypothetical protein IWW36_000373 [Coemansia brasiliensis]
MTYAYPQHYEGLTLHDAGISSMLHLNKHRLSISLYGKDSGLRSIQEKARGLARRRTMNSTITRNSIIDDAPEHALGGYLSDISEDASTFGDKDEHQRQYLNKCITDVVADSIPEWSPVNLNIPKARRRQSIKQLGRRLSLSFSGVSNTISTHNRFRDSIMFAPRPAEGTRSLDRPDSKWPLQLKRRTSWLGSIKSRIKDSIHRRRNQRHDAEATVPIASAFECPETLNEQEENEVPKDPEPAPTFQYPRLRSQPSLNRASTNGDGCSSVHTRDDISFVPDIDNMPSQPRKPHFLLPHRLSIVTQY